MTTHEALIGILNAYHLDSHALHASITDGTLPTILTDNARLASQRLSDPTCLAPPADTAAILHQLGAAVITALETIHPNTHPRP